MSLTKERSGSQKSLKAKASPPPSGVKVVLSKVASKKEPSKTAGNYTDDECYGPDVTNVDAKHRSKVRAQAFVKETLGESVYKTVAKDMPEWVIKCLTKLDKERWVERVETNQHLQHLKDSGDEEAAGSAGKEESLQEQLDILANDLETEREQRIQLEEQVEYLEEEDRRKGGVIQTLERLNENVMNESADLRGQVAQERHDLEFKRREFFLDEIKDMTSTLKHLRSANDPPPQHNPQITRLQERNAHSHSYDYTKREIMLQNSDYPPPSYHKSNTQARPSSAQPQYQLPPYPQSINTMLPTRHSHQSPAWSSASIFTPRGYNERY